MSKTNVLTPQAIQQGEGTANRRAVLVPSVTGKTYTIDLSKNGAQFANANGSATCAEIDDAGSSGSGIYKLQLTSADVATLGTLAVELDDTSNQVYVTGLLVVDHDPFADMKRVVQRLLGKLVTDTSDNTIKTYDDDGSTVILTQTKSAAGTVTTWTPS